MPITSNTILIIVVCDRWFFYPLDLLLNNLSTAISLFQLRLCKNYSAYTPYMPHNFYFVSLERGKSRDENY